ncbi:MAG: hypothetical protein U5N86_04690 [Planctomycetota bacterium]|nr:hypothetical protein [Planctomycetota bacterium]
MRSPSPPTRRCSWPILVTLLLEAGNLASAFGISDKRISIAAAGAATGLFEGERLLETDPDGRFIAALGQNSALRVLCDGAKLETVRKWANIAVENDVALVVDRRGYLVPNALAMSTVDPSAVASSLLRLALRRMNFPRGNG